MKKNQISLVNWGGKGEDEGASKQQERRSCGAHKLREGATGCPGKRLKGLVE